MRSYDQVASPVDASGYAVAIEKAKNDMPTYTLTDVSHEVWVEELSVDAGELGLDATAPWSVTKRRLRGGRRDGVNLVVVDNGALRFAVVPTRGMGLWKGFYQGNYLGWESPIIDGPVHPGLVNLMAGGGLGWLDGFDELMARCGLENNGAPFELNAVGDDGSERHTIFGLHGRIANIPASYVAVHVDAEEPHEIVVEGHVEEARLFGPQIRMETRYITRPGSSLWWSATSLSISRTSRRTCRSSTTGTSGRRSSKRVHGSLPRSGPSPRATPGPPRASSSTTFMTRPSRASPSRCISMTCMPSQPLQVRAAGRRSRCSTITAGDKAVVLRFSRDQLPAFTLWKNTAGLRDGYVTGLEPGTNYPNPRPFEAARGRIVTLPVGGRYVAETTFEVLTTAEEVVAVTAEIQRIQAQGGPATVNTVPLEPFAP